MATLQKIRNRAGLLVSIVIGLALIAFLLGDLLSNNSALLTRNKMEIAKIGKESISIKEFNARVEELATLYGAGTNEEALKSIRDFVWMQMTNDVVLSEEYEKLGLGVSAEELFEVIQGPNPPQAIRQIPFFTNPETGQIDRSRVIQFWQTISQDETGQQAALAKYLEKSALREQLLNKYNNLIKKGLYATSFQAENDFIHSNKTVDFDYIVKDYASVADSLVEISARDIKNYYQDHKKEFQQERSVDIEYVIFNVIPSEEDFDFTKQWLVDHQDEFTEMADEEIAQYLRLNSDQRFENRYYTYNALSDALQDTLFNEEKGFVYGPYFENEAYKLARLVDIAYRPDSVRARHILIKPGQTMGPQQVQNLTDSLQGLLKDGADFADLAVEYSQDPGSAKNGGDLGWFAEGQMVPEFNEAAFTAPIGEIITVDSQFGTHLIKVIDKSENSKKVKVAVLTRNVEPGKNTVQEEYTKAVKFASQNRDRESFVATAEEQGLNKRIASKVRPMDQKIAGIEKPRPLIQWAYESDEGAVSDIFEFTDKYVVASIAKKREEGDQPLEDVEAQVRLRVKKLKKAEYIKNNFNFDNLENTAAEFNTTIETASNINFNSYSVPGAGAEPAVIATAVNMEEGNTSGPVTGEKGVYVIKVTGEDMPEVTEAKVEMQQMRLDRSYQSRANYEPLNVLKKEADIVDNRVDFY